MFVRHICVGGKYKNYQWQFKQKMILYEKHIMKKKNGEFRMISMNIVTTDE